MGASQRAKGKRGELAARDLLRRLWPEASRGLSQSRGGGAEECDVTGCPYHVEVGVGATVSPVAKMAQAQRDCGERTPLVLTKRDRSEWLVTLTWAEFERLARR
jgi:hypothetical protein